MVPVGTSDRRKGTTNIRPRGFRLPWGVPEPRLPVTHTYREGHDVLRLSRRTRGEVPPLPWLSVATSRMSFLLLPSTGSGVGGRVTGVSLEDVDEVKDLRSKLGDGPGRSTRTLTRQCVSRCEPKLRNGNDITLRIIKNWFLKT